MFVESLDNLIGYFTSDISDLYNKEVYFVDSCKKFPSKFSAETNLMDLSLQMFFIQNNKTVINGKMVKYCDSNSKRTIKLNKISTEISPEINVVNNYIVEDKWDKLEW